MYDLTLIKQNGCYYIDSREVADAIGKRHDNLLRDIGKYREIMVRGGLLNFEESDFFVESSYFNAQNKVMPCYLLSKMGCELVANKLTGEKGVLFTIAYVTKFNLMEQQERAEREAALKSCPMPRMSEFNG
ncbi:MAG: Rha family transcriptional regulator, partial [Oscillospiraceae bacterium]|nr:Rha family transcriptional regulator [Oscillospiraceae bacterium]